jgi:antirestriction protein ArdC
MASNDTYNEITSRILQALEEGVPPWRKPWKTSAAHNVRTLRPYRGINTLLLALEDRADGRWGTFKAWKEAGASVRKGERGTRIVLWKTAPKRMSASERIAAEAEGLATSYAFMRTYVVFNAEQCDNAPALEDSEPFQPIERAAAIVAGMPNAPEILEGDERAYYRPSADTVTLPPAESFTSAEAFYVCAFHELAHSVGAPNRLGGAEFGSGFGSDPYAREELVAELTAAMLAGSCEIAFELESSAAYLEGWRDQLSRDPRLIVSAAGEAQRRADYVQGINWNDTGGRITIETEARQYANA